jgi:16S rRNA (cytidine1402-2'-O)-methyltransferase
LAEDTRRTRQLLTRFGISGKRVERLDAHASEQDLGRVAARLGAGEDVALVTDAGTPGVSDPGHALVETAIRHSVRVVPIPGASATMAALAASGLAKGGRFRFFGFLPRGGGSRRAAIATVCETPEPVVLFESPRRTHATLLELAAHAPGRKACIARELTKLHEEFARGSLRDLAADARVWLGEITIVLGTQSTNVETSDVKPRAFDADADADKEIDQALARGEGSRAIAEQLALKSGLPKRVTYARVLERKARTVRQ